MPLTPSVQPQVTADRAGGRGKDRSVISRGLTLIGNAWMIKSMTERLMPLSRTSTIGNALINLRPSGGGGICYHPLAFFCA